MYDNRPLRSRSFVHYIEKQFSPFNFVMWAFELNLYTFVSHVGSSLWLHFGHSLLRGNMDYGKPASRHLIGHWGQDEGNS